LNQNWSGFLNDNISPASIWYGGGTAGIIGSLIFLILALKAKGEIHKTAQIH